MLFAVRIPLVAHPPAFAAVARRTLFATPQINFPAAKTSRAEGKHAAPAKRGKPPKSSAEPEKKQVKQKARIPAELKPPKRAPTPYILFYSSFLKTQPKGTSLLEVQSLTRRAAEVWNGYSMAEKQPFYDESEARKVQANQERDEYFRNTSASELRKINAIRKAQNKPKYHSTTKPRAAGSPFIQFISEFRTTTDGQALISETSPEKKYQVRVIIAAANRWKTMSQEEKEPYFEKFRKAKEELRAEQT